MTGPKIRKRKRRDPDDDGEHGGGSDRRLRPNHHFHGVGEPANDPDFQPPRICADPESFLREAFRAAGKDYGQVLQPDRVDIMLNSGWRVIGDSEWWVLARCDPRWGWVMRPSLQDALGAVRQDRGARHRREVDQEALKLVHELPLHFDWHAAPAPEPIAGAGTLLGRASQPELDC